MTERHDGECTDHYFERVEETEFFDVIRCRTCGFIDRLNNSGNAYLRNGKIETREGQGE